MPDLLVYSFRYGHGELLPTADVVVDVRMRFRDPHIDPQLRGMTGRDQAVVDKVLGTDGVDRYIAALWKVASALLATGTGPVSVAVGCVGGRHRSVVIAAEVARRASAGGWSTVVEHLHVDRPVIQRKPQEARHV
jgi:UPF0042 nucleotide-binding protein